MAVRLRHHEAVQELLQLGAAAGSGGLVGAGHDQAELVAAGVHPGREVGVARERLQGARDRHDEHVPATGVVVRERGVGRAHAVEVEHEHAQRVRVGTALQLGLQGALVGQAGERIDERRSLERVALQRRGNGESGIVPVVVEPGPLLEPGSRSREPVNDNESMGLLMRSHVQDVHDGVRLLELRSEVCEVAVKCPVVRDQRAPALERPNSEGPLHLHRVERDAGSAGRGDQRRCPVGIDPKRAHRARAEPPGRVLDELRPYRRLVLDPQDAKRRVCRIPKVDVLLVERIETAWAPRIHP